MSDGQRYVYVRVLIISIRYYPITLNLESVSTFQASLVQWLEYIVANDVARVRFPDDAANTESNSFYFDLDRVRARERERERERASKQAS